MQIEPWHTPLIVMAVVALPSAIGWIFEWARKNGVELSSLPHINDATLGSLRMKTLVVLTLALLVVCVVVIGQATANIIATAASTVATIVSAALTVELFLERQKTRTPSNSGERPSND